MIASRRPLVLLLLGPTFGCTPSPIPSPVPSSASSPVPYPASSPVPYPASSPVPYPASSPASSAIAAGACELAPAEPVLSRQIRELASEMTLSPPQHGPMMLYSYAFAGYALVNLAIGTRPPPGDVVLLDQLIERALSPTVSKVFGPPSIRVAGVSIARSVAVRGHAALLLSGRNLLGGLSDTQVILRKDLMKSLAADVTKDPNHLLPTHGNRTWPADNEVLAAALALTDGDLATMSDIAEAAKQLQAALLALETTGLPPSAIEPDKLLGTDVPRGCALSWTVTMRGLHDPEAARRLYRKYRERYWVSAGPLAGFREWPPGVQRLPDADSGPIVLGVGASATALGIGAARLAGQDRDATMLLATARTMGLERYMAATGSHWLERAIALFAQTARPWAIPCR